MTRLWLTRIARGAGASLLLGSVFGGLEAFWVLVQTSLLMDPLERLALWALSVASTGAVAGVLGLVLSAAFGAFFGHDDEARGLALDTGRDPRYPWLPGVLALVATVVLLLQGLPGTVNAEPRVAMLSVVLSLLFGGLLGGFLRWFFVRLDSTGRGAALAILGLPTVLVISSSLVVSAPLAGGKGRSVAGRAGLPNLLLITVDGLRADHVGPGSRVRTPTLDWLAEKGVYFRQASTPSTAEGPAHGALLVGRHPLATGYLATGQRLPEALPGSGTRSELPTLADVLSREGFETAAFVSSAAVDGVASGLSRGFTVYDDDVQEGTRGAAMLGVAELWSWLRFSLRGTAELSDVLRPAEITIERFEQWLRYHYRENLFVWLQLSDPVNPTLQVEVADKDLTDAISGEAGRSYGARVMDLDRQLGDLLTRLESQGMMNRTVVAVVGSRGVVPGSTRPNVSEPWTQVPVVLYGPGLELGVEVPSQVRLHDLFPTLLGAVGLHRRPRGDAASLIPLVRGQSITPLQALSIGAPRADGLCAVSLRSENRKFVRQAGGGQALYDLRRDPRELHDLSEKRVIEFEAAASQVTRTLGRPVPKAVLPRSDPGRGPRLRALSMLR